MGSDLRGWSQVHGRAARGRNRRSQPAQDRLARIRFGVRAKSGAHDCTRAARAHARDSRCGDAAGRTGRYHPSNVVDARAPRASGGADRRRALSAACAQRGQLAGHASRGFGAGCPRRQRGGGAGVARTDRRAARGRLLGPGPARGGVCAGLPDAQGTGCVPRARSCAEAGTVRGVPRRRQAARNRRPCGRRHRARAGSPALARGGAARDGGARSDAGGEAARRRRVAGGACGGRVSGSASAGVAGFEKAEVTRGGVPLAELHRTSLESRFAPAVFFCGEVVHCTGRLGGFNFQWACRAGSRRGWRRALRARVGGEVHRTRGGPRRRPAR